MTVPEFHAYVYMDMPLSCHSQLTDDEICNSIRGTTDPEQQCESEQEGETASTSLAPNVCDAIQAMHTIRKFMGNAGADLSYLYRLESQVLQVASSKTSKISIQDFFSLCSLEYRLICFYSPLEVCNSTIYRL